jgi:hypothetical protein
MRNILLLLLLAPLGAFSQSTPFYLADGLVDFSDQMIRGSKSVFVTQVGDDSMIISTSGSAYEHASEYKRNPGEAFLRRTREWGTSLPNYVFFYEEALVLVEEGGSYLLFLKDQNTADGMLGSSDKSFAVRLKDSLRAIVVGINNRKWTDEKRISSVRDQAIVSAYMRGMTSKRDDAKLVRDIKKWSNNTTTTVYIMDADYSITRDYRRDVINKYVPAIIRYRLNGRCYIQWRAFGYEALGGGNFGTHLYTYDKRNSYIFVQGAGSSLRLEQGVAYEIDCN